MAALHDRLPAAIALSSNQHLNNKSNPSTGHFNPMNSLPPPTTASLHVATRDSRTRDAAAVASSPSKHLIKKANSLDHDIFLSLSHTPPSRKISPGEWRRLNTLPAGAGSGSLGGGGGGGGGGSIARTGSTSSLASVTTTAAAGNFQEFKMEIISQGKCLCGQYIRGRLRRAGVLNRKAGQRLRAILEPTASADVVVYEVFPALNSMGEELERMHPRVYTNVSRQLSRAPFGELPDGDTAPMLLNLVAKDLFRTTITWGKIISMFAVCGGFAIDCVRQGHYDYLQCLIDGLGEIIEDDLVYWLADNGGWLGLQQHIRRPRDEAHLSFLNWLTLFVAVSSGAYVVSNFVKHVGCHLYSLLF